ncbi:hypothetical protein ABN034_33390 [Actinopolymorpha sp. B11F2]|uniref:hypothetical protein n=1 Tax=Actinopolymorpha sp. B11F2 TaxID=3160862 RepID=UPI0032E4B739
MYDDEKQVRSVNLLCDYGPGDQTCQQLFTDPCHRIRLVWADGACAGKLVD